MKYLVTGGAGYIGSHMVKMLIEQGHHVVVVDNLCTGHRDAVHEEAVFIRADICDALKLDEVFHNFAFDAVIHFAARSIVTQSISHPALYYRTNVLGTLNLLEAMLRWNIKRFVFSSSAAVYGNSTTTAHNTEAVNPINPYGMTKLMVESMLQDFDTAHGIKSVALRYFNAAGAAADGTLGERHTPETHLIPNAIRAALHGTPLAVYGAGDAVRDYIHVEDLCAAHFKALEYMDREDRNAVLNLGSGGGVSVNDVIDMIEHHTGRKVLRQTMPRRAGDAAYLVANTRRAAHLLRWTPRYTLDDIIQHAINWHKNEEK